MAKRILGIIGAGHVGSHIAYAAGMLHVADVIKLCDINDVVCSSQVQDLNDAVKYMPGNVVYEKAGYTELGDCGVLINTAGKTSMSADNRDNELVFTANLIADCVQQVKNSGFHGIFINVANPCDVITQVLIEKSDLPKGHIFGTGTSLDSARLSSYLSHITGIEQQSFNAIVMGEHGDSQMIPWEHIQFMGQPFNEVAERMHLKLDKEAVRKYIIDSARRIYKGKGCTEFGVAAVTARIARAVFQDEKKIFMVSAPLNGEYGESGICAGVPAVIGADGVEKVVEYKLEGIEKEQFQKSCEKIRQGVIRAHHLLSK